MQKGILKLTKRPLVQAFSFSFSSVFFFDLLGQKPVALHSGQYSEEPQTTRFFYEAFGVEVSNLAWASHSYFILSECESEASLVVLRREPCVW